MGGLVLTVEVSSCRLPRATCCPQIPSSQAPRVRAWEHGAHVACFSTEVCAHVGNYTLAGCSTTPAMPGASHHHLF
eukprot:4029152-Amphidinium_carterae.1